MRIQALTLALALAWWAVPLSAQEEALSDLPDYTMEQRWDRASSQITVSFLAGVAYAKSMGQSPVEYGEFLAKLFVPGWGEPGSGSLGVIRGMHRNTMLWKGAEFEVVDESDTAVTVRLNRPWATYFGEDGTWYGVTLEEWETVFRVFNQRLADHLGLGFEDRVEGDWMFMTISEKD